VPTCSGDEGFTLSAPHAEALVSFLVRMAFLLGEQVKDKDHTVRAPRAARAPGAGPPRCRFAAPSLRAWACRSSGALRQGACAAGLPSVCLTGTSAGSRPRAAHGRRARQGLAREALGLLEGALALWPATPVKLHYIEKLIQQNQAQNLDPPPALVIGAPCGARLG